MLKILVPVDGSECALRALDFATKRAKESPGTTLHLLTVHTRPWVYGEMAIYAGEQRLEQMATLHDQDVMREAEARVTSTGIPFSQEACEGDPPHVIARRARETGCDYIVMGTRGMGGIGNLVLGSVATKVVHLTDLPVTLVK